MQYNFRLFWRTTYRSFFPASNTKARLTRKRIIFLAVFYLVWPIGSLFHWFCFLLDDIFFPGHKTQVIDRPLFILGNLRSGSTFLHRLLSRDEDTFTSLTTWDIYLTPSVIQKKITQLVSRIDNNLGGHRHRILYAFDRATYDEIVEVPLVVTAPGLEAAVVDSQVRSIDLMPTLLELAGLPAREMDGVSLLDVAGDRDAIVAGTDMGALTKLAIRRPPWKLILDVESGEEEAYRLDLDPRELHPRDDAPPELRQILFSELESAERHELTEEEEATVAKRLSDLGYL
jgi:hypothetical protein